uniref:Endonuclease/exonuclease/phosphatase domain-containing protein n=1 Tax=Chenopodium quinoa TaxID=63459 RepID=A0A803L8S1_CHEQI
MATQDNNLSLIGLNNDEEIIASLSNKEITEEVIEWEDNGEDDEEARIELALVGRIWTNRSVNVNAFISTMKEVWKPKHGVEISNIGKNIEIEDPVVPYGAWMKASLWKYSTVYKRDEGGSEGPSCAKPLFITKPKQSPVTHVPKTQIREVADKLGEVELNNDTLNKLPLQQPSDVPFIFSSGNMAGLTDEKITEGEERGSGKIFTRKGWKRNSREGDHSMEGDVKIAGEKRRTRDQDGSEDGSVLDDDNDRGEGRKRSGGLALLWKNNLDVSIKSFSQNHIDAWISSAVHGGWRFTGIYGFPEDENKHKTGVLLKSLMSTVAEPWLVGGDFNLMLLSCEKQGGRDFNNEEADVLRDAVQFCQLLDLGYIGHNFTWTNNRGGIENVQEQLDRYLANHAWKESFPGSFVTHLSKRRSDHLPILLCVKDALNTTNKKKKKVRLYRFEEMWLRDENCADIVASAWDRGGDICSKIAFTSVNLSARSRKKLGDFMRELKYCREKMESLMSETQSEEVIAQMRVLDDRMDELERREELYWKQRSRQEW